jgi:hypothetical protein
MSGGNMPSPLSPEERAAELRKKIGAPAPKLPHSQRPLSALEEMRLRREGKLPASSQTPPSEGLPKDPFTINLQTPVAERPARATAIDPKEMAARMAARYTKASTPQTPVEAEHLDQEIAPEESTPDLSTTIREERPDWDFLDTPERPVVQLIITRDVQDTPPPPKESPDIPEAAAAIFTMMRNNALPPLESLPLPTLASYLATILDNVGTERLESELFLRKNTVNLADALWKKFPDAAIVHTFGVQTQWDLFLIGRYITRGGILPPEKKAEVHQLFLPFTTVFQEKLLPQATVLRFFHRIETLTEEELESYYRRVAIRAADRVQAFMDLTDIAKFLGDVPEEVALYFPLSHRLNTRRIDLKTAVEKHLQDLYLLRLAPTAQEILAVAPPQVAPVIAPLMTPAQLAGSTTEEQIASINHTLHIKTPTVPQMEPLNVKLETLGEPTKAPESRNPVNLKQSSVATHSQPTVEAAPSNTHLLHHHSTLQAMAEELRAYQGIGRTKEISLLFRFTPLLTQAGEKREIAEMFQPSEAIWAFILDPQGKWVPFWDTPYLLTEPLHAGMSLGAGSSKESDLLGAELILSKMSKSATIVPLTEEMQRYAPHNPYAVEFTTHQEKSVRLFPAVTEGSQLEILGQDAAAESIHLQSTYRSPALRIGEFFVTDYPAINGLIKHLHYDGQKGEWSIVVVIPDGPAGTKNLRLTLRLLPEAARVELAEKLHSPSCTGRTSGVGFQRHDRFDLHYIKNADLAPHFSLYRRIPEIIHGKEVMMGWHFTPAVCFHEETSGVLHKRVAALSTFLPDYNKDKDGKLMTAPTHATGFAVYLFEHDGLRWYVLDKETGTKIALGNQLHELLTHDIPDATIVPLEAFHRLFSHTFLGPDAKATPCTYKEIECYNEFQDPKWQEFQAQMYNLMTIPHLLNQQERSAFRASGGTDLVLPVMQPPARVLVRVLSHPLFSTGIWEKPSEQEQFLDQMQQYSQESKLEHSIQVSTMPELWEEFLLKLFAKKVSPLCTVKVELPGLEGATLRLPASESNLSVGYKLHRYEHNRLIRAKGSDYNFGDRDGMTRNTGQNGYLLSVAVRNDWGDIMIFHTRKEDGKAPEFLEVTTESQRLLETASVENVPLLQRNLLKEEEKKELPPLPAHLRAVVQTNSLGLEFEPVFRDYLNGIVRMGDKEAWAGMNKNKFFAISLLSDMARILWDVSEEKA